ncbi:hypothetical protein CMEL01_04022 [Colletotrichum melonis]|uniref:Uncharacterized protein n=1 Tax=Colletotrichum melonis TaxID=1209925 RepID=A0AAI9UBE7_9PEZI|nr:hypothetical protein CMEL01_04022 [Colletotrichum melonis]
MMRRVVCLPACLPACLSKHMLVLVGMWHLIWDLTTAPIKVPLERRTEMLKGSIQFATREWGVFAVYLTNRGGKTAWQANSSGERAGPGPPTRAKIGRDERCAMPAACRPKSTVPPCLMIYRNSSKRLQRGAR